MTTEWDSWSLRFEEWEREEYRNGKLVKIKEPAKCLVAEIEGPHKIACREKATHRSPDGYPVCKHHRNCEVRPDWRGFVEGA